MTRPQSTETTFTVLAENVRVAIGDTRTVVVMPKTEFVLKTAVSQGSINVIVADREFES